MAKGHSQSQVPRIVLRQEWRSPAQIKLTIGPQLTTIKCRSGKRYKWVMNQRAVLGLEKAAERPEGATKITVEYKLVLNWK